MARHAGAGAQASSGTRQPEPGCGSCHSRCLQSRLHAITHSCSHAGSQGLPSRQSVSRSRSGGPVPTQDPDRVPTPARSHRGNRRPHHRVRDGAPRRRACGARPALGRRAGAGATVASRAGRRARVGRGDPPSRGVGELPRRSGTGAAHERPRSWRHGWTSARAWSPRDPMRSAKRWTWCGSTRSGPAPASCWTIRWRG